MMRKEISEAYKIEPAKIGVWTTGVNTELFDKAKPVSKDDSLRKENGLSNSFVVFYHGHLSSGRGLIETVNAMKLLAGKHDDIKLFVLGSGPIVGELKSLVKSSNLERTVIIHGPVDYELVPNFISLADVCVIPLPDHPDWRSQCPLKLLEYLAMEKTIVLSDIPAHRMVVKDESCGIYISSTEPDSIARAIEYAYDNKEKLVSWGKVGREIVERNFTWDQVAEKLENYLVSRE